jgi:hypothetical protein
MKHRKIRHIVLKVRRRELYDLLGLSDDTQIGQVMVDDNGDLRVLLESSDKFPVATFRGRAPTIDFEDFDKPECSSSIFCEHANEVPVVCPCDDDCYCKEHSCKNR